MSPLVLESHGISDVQTDVKQIILKGLTIDNFMGCKFFATEFQKQTRIHGRNEIGKTTIYTAFLWLLTGKNQREQKDFDIKNTVHTDRNRQDHIVSATFLIDGQEQTFTKIYREKWVKKRGEEAQEFTGHETVYSINDVPMSQSEFKAKVDAICPEQVLKLITNVHYFNDMDWKQRRNILTDISGGVDDNELLSANKQFDNLKEILRSGKSLDEFKRELASKKKKIKDELDLIPSRISEATRSKIEDQDYAALQKEIDSIAIEINALNLSKDNLAKANDKELTAIRTKQGELSELKSRLGNLIQDSQRENNQLVNSLKNQISDLEQKLENNNRALNNLMNKISSCNAEIASNESLIQKLRSDWVAENAKTCPELNESETKCPSCARHYESEDIEAMREKVESNFNSSKKSKMDTLTQKATEAKLEIAKLQETKVSVDEDIKKINEETNLLNNKLSGCKLKLVEMSSIEIPESEEIKTLRTQIDSFIIPELPKIDTDSINSEIRVLSTNRDEALKKIALKDVNINLEKRILELTNEEKTKANELANLEKQEFSITNFMKLKNEMVEKKVNDMFQFTTFKMFQKNINGGEEECCIAMFKGVPYNVVNTAGKINMGIDVINVLSSYYKIHAPIFIDNSEASNRIESTDSQLIKLEVSRNETLEVVHESFY